MSKEFIPYKQALALKELGFNDPCLGYFSEKDKYLFITKNTTNIPSGFIKAPLYQQALRWFREKHELIAGIFPNNHSLVRKISYIGYVGNFKKGDIETYYTYEEAELECLKKLIELCKKL